jgi:hypothetical protein
MLLPCREFHHSLDNQARWTGVSPVSLYAHCLVHSPPVESNWGNPPKHRPLAAKPTRNSKAVCTPVSLWISRNQVLTHSSVPLASYGTLASAVGSFASSATILRHRFVRGRTPPRSWPTKRVLRCYRKASIILKRMSYLHDSMSSPR